MRRRAIIGGHRQSGMGTLLRSQGLQRGAVARRLRRAAGGACILAILAVALLHTPIVRARALAFLIAQLADAGFVGRAERLDYNALTLTIRLSEVTIAVPSAVTPFFAAREVRLTLPWAALRGRFAIDHVEIVSPRVTLHRDANGRDNWTPETRGSGAGPIELRIRRGIVRDLAFDWTDDQSASHVDAALSLDLTSDGRTTAGPVVMARPATVRWRDRTTSVALTGGRLSWNDRDLAVEGVSLTAPEGTVTLDGRIDELMGAARIDARVAADANLAAASPWLNLRRAVAGTAHANARVDGSGLEVTGLRVETAGGEATGQARVAFDGGGSAQLKWTRIDLQELLQPVLENTTGVLPSSRIAGELDARWTGPHLEDLEVKVNSSLSGERVAGRQRELPIDGTLAAEVRKSRWTLTAVRVEALGMQASAALAGTLDADDLKRSSITGTINARTLDDREWPRALARAGLVQSAPPVQGPFAGAFTVAGTFGAPLLEGTMEARLGAESLPPSSIRARASATLDAIDLDDIEARIAGTNARGTVRWSRTSDAIGGSLSGSLQLNDLPQLAPSLPRSVALDGSLDFAADLSGSLTRPRAAIRGSGRGLGVAGQTINSLAADGRLDGSELTIDRLLVESEGGRLDASGTLDLARETYTTKASAVELPIHPVLGNNGEAETPLSGRLNGTFEGTGSFQQLGGRGRLSVSGATWQTSDFGNVSSDVTLAGRAATFTLEAPDIALTGRGAIGLDPEGAVSVSASWAPADVAAVAQRLSIDVPVSGAVSLGLEWTGTREHIDRGRGQLSVNRADLAIADQKFSLAQPGRIDADGRVIRVSPLVLTTGSSRLTIDGALGDVVRSDRLSLTLDGSLADFGFIRDLIQPPTEGAPEPPPLVGSIHAGLTAEGTLADPRLSGALQVRGGSVPLTAQAQVTDLEVGAHYDGGVVIVDRMTAAFEGASLSATARVPSEVFIDRLPEAARRWVVTANGPGTLSAQVRAITPAVVAPFVDKATLEQIALHADATIELEAERPDVDRLRGSIVLNRAEMALGGVALDQEATTRLGIGNGRLTIESWTWGRDNNRVTLSGGVALAADPALDVTADATLDLRLLNAFAPTARTAGRADAELRLRGRASAPTLDGYLTITGGETRMADPRLIVGDLAGTVTLAGDTLTLQYLSATVNGGNAELTGSIRHRWLVPIDGAVTLTAKGSALDVVDVRAEADAAITWTLDSNRSTVGGSVTLLRSAYREQLSVAGNLLAALKRSSAAIPVPGASGPSLLDRTRLDVRLLTDEDLLIDNNVARLSVHGDLRAVGPAASPSVTGRVELGEGGVVFFNGTRYRLSDRRSIDFANPNRIEPDLDLSAVARVQGYEIAISLKGTPSTLETTLESTNDKSLSQSDLVSLLLIGRKTSEGEVPGSEELVGLLTGNFLEAAGRAIGFDTARVERGTPDLRFDAGLVAAETDPGARLTFGKSIGSHVELVFSQSLQQSGGLTWIVGYKPRSGIDLRFVTLDQGDRLYTFSHDITFGGPAVKVSAAEAPTIRVSAVTITGAGSDEAALRSRLKLAPQDRFSFFKWQDDRERLEAFYHDRQRLEARITTRRIAGETDATRVGLSYDIRPGPRTTVIVEGYQLSSSAMASIERAWARSVVDDFLIEEVDAIARVQLADQGYLVPTVTARIDSSADARELRATIVPGQRFRSRRVEFSGNANEPSERLLAAITERGLTRAVWTDPDAVRDALTTLYRANGYLNAAVRLAPIAIDRDTAVRPVEIVEGKAFRVGAVTIEGVHVFAPEEAARLVGLTSGDPYRPSQLEQAQIALDTQYRARGFNRAGIDYQAAADDLTNEVAVVVRVDEGPQQRLRDIETVGLSRTNPSLLRRALIELKPDEPVDLTAWNAARRRAYETGAFRSVDIQREVITPAEPAPPGEAAIEPVRAKVTVQEWPPFRVRYGLEVRDELDAAGDAARANAPGTEQAGSRRLGLGLAGDLGARGLFGRAVSAGVAGRFAVDH